MVLPDFAAMLRTSEELDRLEEEQEQMIVMIDSIHKKLRSNPEVVLDPGDNSLERLKTLYANVRDLSEREAELSNLLISQLDRMYPSEPRQGRSKDVNDLKRRRTKTDSDTKRVSSNVQIQPEISPIPMGEQVAARITGDDAQKDEWIVVKVIKFDSETREYEVVDEEPDDDDDKESCFQRMYKLPISRIIPFPKQNNPRNFPFGKHVLAVYPGTTSLYKATVVNPHRKKRTDGYLLEFDGDEVDGILPQRPVPFHQVILLPQGHRQ